MRRRKRDSVVAARVRVTAWTRFAFAVLLLSAGGGCLPNGVDSAAAQDPLVVERPAPSSGRPHIVVILADDLGWNDVGFHGSEAIKTPNIDKLAYSGVMLNNYYVTPICTPSRSALMTGKYPIHTGMEHSVVLETEPWGLGLEEVLMPQYLAQLGYSRHIVGKWHLGFFEKEYTPTFRGFQTHFGYWTGRQDYYSHFAEKYISSNFFMTGLDMRLNLNPAHNTTGKYSTDLFTEAAELIIHHHNTEVPLFLYLSHLAVHSANRGQPLQAPKETVDQFPHIKDEKRRTYAAMVAKLDESVGRVFTALGKKGMLNNTIIVFSTDNGGAAAGFNYNAGSNWPLRGVKNTRWEGGVKGVGFLWSPLLNNGQGIRSNKMMHIVDWLPTLLSAAGVKRSELPQDIDGISMWDALVEEPLTDWSPRNEMLLSYDPLYGVAVYRYGDWKILNGTTYEGYWDGWYGPAEQPSGSAAAAAAAGRKDPAGKAARLSQTGAGDDDDNNLGAPTDAGARGNSVDWPPSRALPLMDAGTGNSKVYGGKVLNLAEFGFPEGTSSKRFAGRALEEGYWASPHRVDCGPKVRQRMGTPCLPLKGRPCLFHIPTDPCEYHNVADLYPEIVDGLWTRMMAIAATAVPARNKPHDPEANPAKHCYLWDPWKS